MEIVFGSVGRSRSESLHGFCHISHHLCGPEAGLPMQRRKREGSERWRPSWDHGSPPLPNWCQHRWTEPTKPPPSFPLYPSKQPFHSSFLPLGTPCPELLDSGLGLVTLGAPAPGLELPSPACMPHAGMPCGRMFVPLKNPAVAEVVERACAVESAGCGLHPDLPLGSHDGSGALSLTSQRPSFPICINDSAEDEISSCV